MYDFILVLAVLMILLLSTYAFLLITYRSHWLEQKEYSTSLVTENVMSFTIIIPARDEAKNIAACLESICRQAYPKEKRQVIVVNDHSTDATAAIVASFAGENVMLLNLADYVSDPINSYKKKAIETAMQFATGNYILSTDADCIASEKWLVTLNNFCAEKQPAFVAMPVMFHRENTPLSIFQSLDFLSLQGITGASVHAGALSMCNGANLGYSKSAYKKVKGFEGISHIASGDDMLLMHKIAKAYPQDVHYLKSSDVIVHTDPMPSVAKFFSQRIRWASKSGSYEDKRITIVLSLVYGLNLILLIAPIIAIFYNPSIISGLNLVAIWAICLALKMIFELYFLVPVAQFFNVSGLLFWFPLAQPFHIVYTVIAGWMGMFGKYEWKGRKVH